MKLPKMLWTVVAAIVVTMSALTISGATPTTALAPTVIYDSTVSPLPGNLPSLAFQSQQTSEFGDQVTFASTNRNLSSVTVTLSSWACQSGSWSTNDCLTASGATFAIPITFNIYAAGSPAPGTLLATLEQTFNVPYRPSASVTCTGDDAGKWYSTSDSLCFNGLANNIIFDFSTLNVVLPDTVVYGIAYNTSGFGLHPLGYATACASTLQGCPYDSLNVGLNTTAVPTVGIDDNPDDVFWNTATAALYADGGTDGVGIFRRDTGWTGYVPAVQFNASGVCQSTGFIRDGKDLTAAQIGGTVDGALDATGCNIGVYYDADHTGNVTAGANIYGANYFGVVVNHAAVNVTKSQIHNIGDVPFDGNQYGRAILYTGGASGTVSGNTVSLYQKNGIVIDGLGTAVTVSGNTVTGRGPITSIAQNGIVIISKATASVTGNTITDNYYTPTDTVACGILFYDAGGVKQSKNVLSGNEVNICNVGRGGGKFNP